jgi:tRNA(Ile)-lysidine synthase
MSTKNHDVLRAIRKCIAGEKLFEGQSKIIVAVSGGIDSMTLLYSLIALETEFELSLAVAHVNYGLRGVESDSDEHLVREYAESNGIPVFIKKINPDDPGLIIGGSVQVWARDIRYGYFEELRTKHKFDLVATGHTSDDNAETVFLNLIRGSGLDGLRGIPPKRGTIIRPMIYISRKDIEAYAGSGNIPYRIDISNKSDRFARNVLRNEVFPLMESKLRENVLYSINRTSSIIRSIDDYIHETAQKQYGGIVRETGTNEFYIGKKELQSLHPVITDYLLRDIVSRVSKSPASFELTRRIRNLIYAPAGNTIFITPEYRVDSEASGIRFLENKEPERFTIEINLYEEYRFGDFTFRSSSVDRTGVSFDMVGNIEYIDADKIKKSLVLRTWQKGDRLQPLGMRTFKKVSDIFIDAKIPRSEKHRIPLLTTDEDIIWICGLKLDDRFKVDDNTRHIIKLEYIPHGKR